MNRALLLFAAVTTLVPVVPEIGLAASFNCALANTPTEHAICNNAQLGRLDEQSSGMYFQIIGSSPPLPTLNQVRNTQRSFLAQRNACGANFDCIVDSYTSQIMYLRNEMETLGLRQ